ncbi:precorrin-6y C5,15-methyltransferase (decarboxylating) subunit CbiE [Sphingomonas sp. UV9]|uniref:precorrin-6y C5,15-methyltransferase (decarboxylating) subunit CbiE n=1 Tax=Sphingomonas sp. UV9 TaxID=1851410 RepID=UPI000FFBFDFD|nr:precorrin-6y C5,15-methyltransferase (decarboxylating) subunit CbiE [Sphingomonas sp. UV9]RXD06779.1 precorrin-6y C5,15-methyltransferase (decarboxylating) subunit CbiE [Sphingomonas sp. UV9]
MADTPWLTIIGLGEDGAAGLSDPAKAALAEAELVTGAARHLALLPDLRNEVMSWPVPFDAGIPRLLDYRGRRVAMLVSGDPFWFGAGTAVTRHLAPTEWIAYPAPSTFGFAAARLGWPLDNTACLGLHAAPLSRLRRHISPDRRALVLLRDGEAVAKLASYLNDLGFGASYLHILEALGGPRERIREATAATLAFDDIAHPVAIGIAFAGGGTVLPRTSGLPDAWFEHDGQITKRPVRALTLSALAPKPGETLWDIGAGSGSIGIEWLLSHPSTKAIAFEADPVRADRIRTNAAALGVDRLHIVQGRAPDALQDQAQPDAVFIGGGLSEAMLDALWTALPTGTRLVANAVTLESEALLANWHAAKGGTLMRIELSDAAPLGTRRGWRASYPVVQWSVVL